MTSALVAFDPRCILYRSRKKVVRLAAHASVVAFALLAAVRLQAQTPVPFPSTEVGQQAAATSVTITMSAAGPAAALIAVTTGVQGMDYTLGTSVVSNACVANAVYNKGDQCRLSVIFTPKFPGQRLGAVEVRSTTGTLLGETFLTALATGPLAVQVPGEIITVAGNSQWLYQGDGFPANVSSIFLPMGVAVDAAGNMFISDSSNNRIRYVPKQTGLISTVAGNGSPAFAGDNGQGVPSVSGPGAMVLDGAGNLYFADTGNSVIRRLDAVTGQLSTVAGTGGVQGYTGDGGPATSAKLSLPEGLAFDAAMNLYIADTGNNVVRRVDALTGIISTYAGTANIGFAGDGGPANAARLNTPWGVTVGPDGMVYIADLENNRVRRVDASGNIATVVGNGDGVYMGDSVAPLSSQLDAPAAVVFDPAGDMYIADSGDNRVREISVATGLIETIAGTGGEQFIGDTGPANTANIYGPYALTFDQAGNLFIADMFHNRIREITATGIRLGYDTIRVGKISAPQIEAVQNAGNANMTLSAPSLDNTALDAATTTCNIGMVLALGASCNLGVEFAPTTLGNSVTGTLDTNSDAANTPTVVNVYGPVLSVNPTSVTLVSSLNPSMVGSAVTFTATIASGGATLAGNVSFLDGSVVVCSGAVNANGMASCTTSALALGSHSMTASYEGDTNDAASVSSILLEIVKQQASVALGASPNPAVVTTSVQLTATVTAANGTPGGTVTFYDGSTPIGSALLNASGVAVFSTTSLTAATHSLTAVYSGDANNAVATSNTVTEVVSLAATSTTLATSGADVAVGSTVGFTATVSTTQGILVGTQGPTGSVQFFDGSTSIGSGNLNAGGVASFSTALLVPGVHKILATYGGDADDATSSSTMLTETIEQIGTAVTLVSSANPANAGASVQLTANVALMPGATADGAITGKVTFSNGSTVLGTAVVDANGNASLSLSTLPVGSGSIVAAYGGSTNYAASTSAALVETIRETSTTTAIISSNPNAYAGKAVTFSATVTTGTGLPTGGVTFLANGKTVGTGTLNASSVATLTLSTLGVGTQQMTAVFAGDSNYVTSTSPVMVQAIALATPAVSLDGPTLPVNAGVSVTLTGTIVSAGVTPTGALTLLDGTQAISTQNASANGSYSFSSASLGVGAHALKVAYAGDADNAAVMSTTFSLTVQQAPTATALASSASPQVLGQPVTLTAAVSSVSPNVSGDIAFYDNGSALGTVSVGATGNAALTTSTLTFGSHSITATYSGDTNHATSSATAVSELIVQSAGATLTSSVNPAVAGVNVAFTMRLAAVGGIVPAGSIVFADAGTPIGTVTMDGTGTAVLQNSTLAVGSHTITASYAGDKNYSSTSANLIQTVQSANTQVGLSASASPATYLTAVSLTATITSNGGVPTGSVSFTDGGASIGSALLNANGVATLALSSLAPGTHTIVATYAGDGKAGASVSSPLAVVVKETTQTALASSANPAQTLAPITLTATITNNGVGAVTGNVTFTDGSTLLGMAAVGTGGVATLALPSLSAGNHALLASYAGDADDFASVSASMAQSVTLRPTTTTLTASETNINNTEQITLISVERWTGTTTPTGTVTFMSGNTVIGSSPVDATGVATLTIVLQSPSVTFTATYAGDNVYAGSVSPSVAVSGGAPVDFTLTLNPASVTLQSKAHSVTTLTIQSIQAFTDTLQLGCVGLPTAASCTFSTTQAKLAAGGTATVTITVDTGDPLGSGAESASLSQRSGVVLYGFLPVGLLAGLAMFRKRRRSMLGLLMVLVAILSSLGITGCGGLSVNGTPAGSYAFKVTAVGQQTGVSVAQVMSLTVTK